MCTLSRSNSALLPVGLIVWKPAFDVLINSYPSGASVGQVNLLLCSGKSMGHYILCKTYSWLGRFDQHARQTGPAVSSGPTCSAGSGANMPMPTQELVTLSLTGDQLEAIEVFFAHHNWPLDILEQKEIVLPLANFLRPKLLEVSQEPRFVRSREATPDPTAIEEDDLGATKIVGLLDVNELTFDDFQVDDDPCADCFHSPCVALRSPTWLGQGCPPKDGNNMLRKDRYVKYVKYLKTLGVWGHPAYVLHKREALAAAANRTPDMVWVACRGVSPRELLPGCVVRRVRELYPNPPGRGYDGEAPFFKLNDKNRGSK